jgi:hypothetical protein
MLIPFLPPTRVMTALAEAPGHLLSLFVIRYQNGPVAANGFFIGRGGACDQMLPRSCGDGPGAAAVSSSELALPRFGGELLTRH